MQRVTARTADTRSEVTADEQDEERATGGARVVGGRQLLDLHPRLAGRDGNAHAREPGAGEGTDTEGHGEDDAQHDLHEATDHGAPVVLVAAVDFVVVPSVRVATTR